MPHVAIATEARTCPEHGQYQATQWDLRPKPARPRWTHAEIDKWLKPFWSNCPTCDAAWQRQADENDAAIRGGMSAKAMAAASRQKAMNIPERLKNATVWNWTHGIPAQRKVWDWARDYASAFETAIEVGRCGIFYGTAGTGKSHLAVGLLRHVGEKGGTGLYTTAGEMFARIKATYSPGATESEQAVTRALVDVDLLVIDEVGRTADTDWEKRTLFGVLDARYRHLKPVIVVSNLERAELIKYLGDALIDRLRESGGAMLLFDWGSHRDPRMKIVKDEDQ